MSDGLTQFLYLLMRDKLSTVEVELLVLWVEATPGGLDLEVGFTNSHLADYARKLATRIEAA